MNHYTELTAELLDFIKASPSCYHVIDKAEKLLDGHHMTRLREDRLWQLTPGRSYYVERGGSSLIAFAIPENEPDNYQIIASHSDSPTFKIKENADISRDGHYVELNVERYGGMLCAPWFDRPLSIAGRVVIQEEQMLKTRLVNFDRDLLMLPSLAIHMDRTANDNASYKIQTDMLPLLGDPAFGEFTFMDLLAHELKVDKEQIIAKDLFLYNRSLPSFWGARNEFFSSPRLDDLQCAFSSLKAFTQSNKNPHSICVCAIFDNEEVGSQTKQGANSTFLSDVLSRIASCLGYSKEKNMMMINSGFMVSADNAHAVHPNHISKADPTNHPHMNMGVVIKHNANQKYTTDAISAAIFTSICKKAKIPTQTFVNHSDVAGGSTLGNISNSHVSMNTVDIGAAQLGMHSPYETGGILDTWHLTKAMEAFYASHISRNDIGDYFLD